jgi:hypothetical protein
MAIGYWDITAEERVDIYRRYVELARAHWGRTLPQAQPDTQAAAWEVGEAPHARPADSAEILFDDHARARLREFLRWHVGFWVRYVPRRPDGSWPTMQGRETFEARSPLETLLSRTDDAAGDYITDELLDGGDLSSPPAPGVSATEPEVTAAG